MNAVTTTATAPGLASARRHNLSVWTESAHHMYAGRVDEFLACWTSDATYTVAYPVAGLPPSVTGHEALRAVFGGLTSLAREIHVHDVRFHQTDDPDVVFVEERMIAVLHNGYRYDNRLILRATFRDGLIHEVFEYYGQVAHQELVRQAGLVPDAS